MDEFNQTTPVAAPPAEHEPAATPAEAAPATKTVSDAVQKFKSCRWRCEPDAGEFCTHRDVLPFAGKEGFSADSWCPNARSTSCAGPRRSANGRTILTNEMPRLAHPCDPCNPWFYSRNSFASSAHSPLGASS